MLDAVADAYRERRDDVDALGARSSSRRSRARREVAPSARAADRLGAVARRARGLAPGVRRRVGRLRRRAEVPAGLGARVPARAAASRSMVDGDARRDGRRRDVRPGRRRLPPLLGRRRAGSCRTSRRCSTTTRCSSPRTCTRWRRHRRRALPARWSRRRSTTCSATSRSPGGGFASSQDADTDGVEGLTYTWTEAEGVPAELLQPVRARPLDHPRRARRRSCGRGCSTSARARPQPARDDKAIAAWNGLALAALAEARPETRQAPRCHKPPSGSGASCSARSRRPTAGSTGRGGTGGRAIPGYLEDYADVAHGLYELHVATGELRWLEEAQPAGPAGGRALRRRGARRLLP